MTRTHTSRTRPIPTGIPTRVSTRVTARAFIGLLIAAVSVVGVVRTFDPVQVSAAQVAFLLSTVVGVAIAQLHVD